MAREFNRVSQAYIYDTNIRLSFRYISIGVSKQKKKQKIDNEPKQENKSIVWQRVKGLAFAVSW